MNSWKEALENRSFRLWFILAVAGLITLAFYVPYFFQNVIQPKAALPVDDVFMDLFAPVDWSLAILSLLYAAIVLSLLTNFQKPVVMLAGLWTYGIVTWIRMGTIYAITLEPPAGVIPLTDPFLKFVVYNQSNFVKDLFFSGHISSMTIMFLLASGHALRWVLGAMTLAMAVLLLWQHAHYTIDLVAAPPITWIVYRVVRHFIKKLLPN